MPLVLVIVALLGSVALPARQTWRITRLLRETTEVLAPARVIEAQLQTGIAKELATLQSFALAGDPALLGRYRAAAAEDERRLVALERLAARFDIASAGRTDVLRRRIGSWREAIDPPTARPASRAEVAVALEREQPRYDAVLSAFAELSSDLAATAAARNDRVRALEHLSLTSNALLVLAALLAMAGVATLTIRERRLTVTLRASVLDARRRARQEAALREAAEALAAAYTIEELTQWIVRAAPTALDGHGAFIEQIVFESGEPSSVTVVQATDGTRMPPLATTLPFAGSYTEWVTTSGRALLIEDFEQPERRGAVDAVRDAGASAIAVPLGGGGRPMGALFVVRSTADRFSSDDVARAGIFGHLATLAFEKVRLLEDAHERRRMLERVMQSRSRLMRGFSHDVKNPIGAADGYADLLSAGVFGELSPEQHSSVARMRRCLHGALGLIDDLHELARAETGILSLSSAPVDLAELARTICEEYHAAARAAGLSLSVEVALGLPVVDTDGERVRQIVSNLLSNAIKYTASGSVLVRTTHRVTGLDGEAGEWALVEVIDTGPGIPAHQQDVIFDEFSRLGTGTHRGAGLGLAISRLLAQALGGHISVQSEPAHGSTFTLWLPLREPAPSDRAPSPAEIPEYRRT